MDKSLEAFQVQMREWRAYYRSKGKMPHPMHLEVPIERAFSTFYACQKAGINCEEPNVEPVARKDYSPWMDDEVDEIIWPFVESLLSEYEMVPDPSIGGSSSQPPAST